MNINSVQVPFSVFNDSNGSPLDAGYIYIGQIGFSAETNPIPVYFNADFTSPAAQPIRTLNGYPSNNGTPAKLFVGSAYSMTVRDSGGNLIYSVLNNTDYNNSLAFNVETATGDGTTVSFGVSALPSFINIGGVIQQRSAYSYSSGNVVFTEAPPYNAKIEFLI